MQIDAGGGNFGTDGIAVGGVVTGNVTNSGTITEQSDAIDESIPPSTWCRCLFTGGCPNALTAVSEPVRYWALLSTGVPAGSTRVLLSWDGSGLRCAISETLPHGQG